MIGRFSQLIPAFVLGLMLASGPALADSSAAQSTNKQKANPDYSLAEQAIEDGNYERAIALLEKVAAKEPKNANALNLLGYSNRQLGNNDVAMKHYEAALKLNPRHRGANEYMGRLYLIMGEVEKAEERLAVLDDACFFGCKEYTMLKEAIAEHKAKLGS